MLVSAGATGLAGVRAMGVACGAPVGFGRVCVRGAQKEVGQRFRKGGEEKAVAGAQCGHPVVVAQMRKRRGEGKERVLVTAKRRRQQLEPPARRRRARRCPKEPPPRRCLKRGRSLWRSHGRKVFCSPETRARRRKPCGERSWNGERWRVRWGGRGLRRPRCQNLHGNPRRSSSACDWAGARRSARAGCGKPLAHTGSRCI